jgi:Flp pilus assembly CpaE family ATPase
LSVNLASAARHHCEHLLLADLDSLAGTLAFVLKLKSHHSFVDALCHAGNLDPDLWKGLVVPYRDFEVLLSPHNPIECMEELRGVAGLLSYIRHAYDVSVLDTGGFGGRLGLDVAKLSDEVILVASTELASLYSAKRWITHLSTNGVPKNRMRLVVSRFRRGLGVEPEEVEDTLGLRITQIIPSDPPAVEAALIEGRPVAVGSAYGRSVTELAGLLMESTAKAGRSPARWGLRSLFSI